MLTDSIYHTHDTAQSASRASARPQWGGCYPGTITPAPNTTHTHTRAHTHAVHYHSKTTTLFEPGTMVTVVFSAEATWMTQHFL